MSLSYEDISISSIKEYEHNNKKHSDNQISAISESIKEFGFLQPVVVDANNIIVVGHGRVKAAKEIGMTDVPVVRVEGLTESQIRRYRILDNKLSDMAEWDIESIKIELEEIQDEELNDMFPEIEIDDNVLLQEESEDIIPQDTDKIYVEKGDIFQLGEHRLMCGDTTNIEDVGKVMDGNKADMVFTDPPYNTGMKANGSTWLNHMFDDDFSDEEWEDFMHKFVHAYSHIMKDNSVAYICLDWRRNNELIPHIKNYFHLSNIIVRDKVVHGLGSDYKYTYELINVCKKGKPILNTHQGDREYSDIWHIQRKMGRDDDHATKKPLEVCERGIRHGSKKGDIVTDLFGGSGSTLIACEKTKRKCYMMELDPKYIQVIIKRYNRYTQGKKIIKCINREDLDIKNILDA